MLSGILIIGDPGAAAHCAGLGERWGRCDHLPWTELAAEQLLTSTHRLILLDAGATDADLSHVRRLLDTLRVHPLHTPVCAILPSGDADLLSAASETLDDFLVAPANPAELLPRLTRLLGPANADRLEPSLSEIADTLSAEMGLRHFVGRDPAFLRVPSQISLFAANEAPVLITGETGTGKELCARVLHLLSRRQRGPFIPVDCGALPDHLFENEVFGHARGAFTDARTDQKGLVALANRGTLFLDEIDSLSLPAQSKVLRLLQEQTYRPLGSETFKQADTRILAATNSSLDDLVARKTFRADLFFRINVLRIHMPALRDRPTDIPLLSRHFIAEIATASHLPRKVLSAGAEHRLQQHHWPGNVRELYNILQRAVLCSSGTQIPASAIDLETKAISLPAAPSPGMLTRKPVASVNAADASTVAIDFRRAKLGAIHAFERDYVHDMMQKHAGNITQAAREAGKDRRAFGRLAKKYDNPS